MPKLSKIGKRILGIFFIVGASSFLVSGTVGIVGEAHAQDSTQTSTTTLGVDKTEIVGIVDLVLKVIYILLWPLLVIAGLSLDNTMVYGGFLHMDAPLWAFRNIIKNFANFALGFLVLFAIIRKIFSFGKAGDKWEPQKIITQTLIAGVLIQISRFVMAALVDLSTVATYAIGALPLNIVSSTDLGKHKIMNAHVELDLTKFQKIVEGNEYYKVRYSVPYAGGELNFSECKQKNGYIVGRMDGGTGFRNDIMKAEWGGTKNACVKGNQLVFFNEFPNAYDATTNAEYQAQLEANLGVGVNVAYDKWEACKYIIRFNGPTKGLKSCSDAAYDVVADYIFDPNNGYDETKYSWLEGVPPESADANYGGKYGDSWLQNNPAALTLDAIVDKSKGFIGPLITMYSSMLDFAQLANTSSDTSFGEISAEMLIKTGFAIGLFFPLVALAIVLIIRIAFMRAVIVLSPFLVLVKAFGWEDKLGEGLKKHFNLANVFKVIFAPVVTVFALSISLVFMSVLMASIKTGGTTGWGTTLTASEAGSQVFSFFKDCMELKLDGFDFGGAVDVFSWFLMNMMGIGLMRAIVFAAIKANSIGEKIGEGVQTFGSNFFQTLPILPVPGGEPVGLRSFTNVIGNVPQQYVGRLEEGQRRKVEKRVGFGEGAEVTGLTATQAQQIVTKVVGGTTPTAAVAAVAGVGEVRAGEIAAAGMTEISKAVGTLTGPERTTVATAFETAFPELKNQDVKQAINTAIGTETSITTVNSNIGALPPLPAVSESDKARIRNIRDEQINRTLKDETGKDQVYILNVTDDGRFVFIKK